MCACPLLHSTRLRKGHLRHTITVMYRPNSLPLAFDCQPSFTQFAMICHTVQYKTTEQINHGISLLLIGVISM